MNRILVDGTPHLITEAYCAGARAKRLDTALHANPFAMSDPQHSQWSAGYEHEADLLHVCEGEDVIRLSRAGSQSFAAQRPDTRYPRRAALGYAYDRMISSGMISDTYAIMSKEGLPMPGALAKKLASKHDLTVSFAKLLIRRIQLEKEIAGEPLSTREADKLQSLTPKCREFLLALGELQNAYYDKHLPIPLVSRHFKQNEYWGLSMARTFMRDGFGFLIQGSVSVCRPSLKGWTAIEILKSHTAELDLNAARQRFAA